MRRNSKLVAALVGGLLVIGCTTAVAASTSTPVECDVTDNTLTCPLPEPPAPVTETQTVTQTPDPVTVTETATTTVSVPAGPETLFGDAIPANPADADNAKVELGVKFKPALDGVVTGVRFYKGAGNTGTHTGSLWSGTVRVATVTFANETETGWQQAKFATPIVVKAGTEYVASYLAPVGHYAGDGSYAWPKVSGNLTGLQGLYKYDGGLPTNTYNNSNYYVDVLFLATGNPPATTAPSTTAPTSAPATTAPVTTSPVTTAPTTTQPPAGTCIGAANTPGGPDPWGGCWPGPQNTGVAEGTVLKVLNPGEDAPGLTWEGSGWNVGACGTIIDGYEIHGSLYFRYGNTSRNPDTPCVTIKNTKVLNGLVDLDVSCLNAAAGNAADHCGPVVIQDSELYSEALADRAEVIYDDFHIYRTEIQGTPLCNGNCTLQDSWVHSLYAERGFHMDAVSSNGNGPGNAFTVKHNWLDCGGFKEIVDPQEGLGCSTVLASFPDFASITLKASYNYLAPALRDGLGDRNYQPPYCLNPGPGTTKPYPTVNTVIDHNVFARGFTGHCGLFGAVYGFGNGDIHQNGTDSGNVWGPGNIWDDGTPMDTPNANATFNCSGQGCITY